MKRLWLALAVVLAMGLGCGLSDVGEHVPKKEKKKEKKEKEEKEEKGRSGGNWLDEVSIQVQGETRTAMIHVPNGYSASGDDEWPVIFAFHGGSGNSSAAMSKHWKKHRDGDFILVLPNGQTKVDTQAGWFSVSEDPLQHVWFIRDLVAEVSRTHRVDSGRVYAAGFSNGGYMTMHLACQANDLFAGFSVVSQTLYLNIAEQCSGTHKRPMMYMIGDKDPKSFWHGKPRTMGVDDTLAWFLDRNGCPSKPSSSKDLPDKPGDKTSVHRSTWNACSDVPGMRFYKITGGGHSWPGPTGSGEPDHCSDVSASEETIEFFREFAGLNKPGGIAAPGKDPKLPKRMSSPKLKPDEQPMCFSVDGKGHLELEFETNGVVDGGSLKMKMDGHSANLTGLKGTQSRSGCSVKGDGTLDGKPKTGVALEVRFGMDGQSLKMGKHEVGELQNALCEP
jgi:polyhydroxybutyrate depolymerase